MTALVPTETAEATPAPPAATMLSVQGEGEAPKTMADMFLKSEVGLLVLAYVSGNSLACSLEVDGFIAIHRLVFACLYTHSACPNVL